MNIQILLESKVHSYQANMAYNSGLKFRMMKTQTGQQILQHNWRY
ncbi:EF-hand calcium-binding domain-containing protein 14 [Apodemus speciosus]|uniref:EF-hand calcium-binding domain-containing protein 14 n=1 Tax=Apodemus speciosus TaxID=105296 RepID=A0ABQ0F3I2_APOSI